jgi:hypothetical protein
MNGLIAFQVRKSNGMIVRSLRGILQLKSQRRSMQKKKLGGRTNPISFPYFSNGDTPITTTAFLSFNRIIYSCRLKAIKIMDPDILSFIQMSSTAQEVADLVDLNSVERLLSLVDFLRSKSIPPLHNL